MKRYLAVAVLLGVAVAVPQDVKHAPTFQSCLADINLWTSQMPGWPETTPEQLRSATKLLTVREMNGRIASLIDCGNSYPEETKPKMAGRLPVTITLTMFYDGEISERYADFLTRHAMAAKFVEEDEAGQR